MHSVDRLMAAVFLLIIFGIFGAIVGIVELENRHEERMAELGYQLVECRCRRVWAKEPQVRVVTNYLYQFPPVDYVPIVTNLYAYPPIEAVPLFERDPNLDGIVSVKED